MRSALLPPLLNDVLQLGYSKVKYVLLWLWLNACYSSLAVLPRNSLFPVEVRWARLSLR